jgi:hypothetical protein
MRLKSGQYRSQFSHVWQQFGVTYKAWPTNGPLRSRHGHGLPFWALIVSRFKPDRSISAAPSGPKGALKNSLSVGVKMAGYDTKNDTKPPDEAILSTQVPERMAGTTGLEPAASAVTGQRSNQLNYVPTLDAECQMVGSAGLEPATSCL